MFQAFSYLPYHFHSAAQGSETGGSVRGRQRLSSRPRDKLWVCICACGQQSAEVAGVEDTVQSTGSGAACSKCWRREWVRKARESGNLAEEFLLLASKTEP